MEKTLLNILIGIALTACQEASVLDDPVVEQEPQPVDLVLTRAEGDALGPRTYRAMLFRSTNKTFTGYEGTYFDPGEGAMTQELIPWKVKANGEKDDDATERDLLSGLYAQGGNYYLLLA